MSFKAEIRTETGTKHAKALRREGKIPTTLYTPGKEPISLAVDSREFEALLKRKGTNAVFNIEFDGQTRKVLVKDYQKGAIKDEFYSIDLQGVIADQMLQVEVPLNLVNVKTVKVGIVEQVMNSILVESKPDVIPSSLELDVKGMEIGDTKAVTDIDLPEGVILLEEENQTVVSVSAPTEEPSEDEETGDASEPQVIGESAENAE